MEAVMIEYAPLVIVIICILFKSKLFVTPDQLTAKVDLIKDEIKKEYATKETVLAIKADIKEIKDDVKFLNNLLLSKVKTDIK